MRGGKTARVSKKAKKDADEDEDSDGADLLSGKPGLIKCTKAFWESFFDPTFEQKLKPKPKKKGKKGKKPALSGTGYSLK